MLDIYDISSYDYELPSDLIASAPIMPKSAAKLLVYNRKNNEISHLHFSDLPEILPECSIIFNDTKVVKARIYGAKETGGKIELLLNSPLENNKFSAYIRGSVKIGTILNFDKDLQAKVIKLYDDGLRAVEFSQNGKELNSAQIFEILSQIGHVPLPPYIKREDKAEDINWYQSIFAKNEGAVAAPTASLHFDDELISKLKLNHETAYITLHVGAGTFKPVEVENINEHKMHSEFYDLSKESIEIINNKNKKILGVGTTVTRTIEFYARNKISSGFCDLFLNPANKPIRQDYLLTNFHLPKSTLIMLVASFIGLEKTLELYKIAVDEKYRFYSYGDGMLII